MILLRQYPWFALLLLLLGLALAVEIGAMVERRNAWRRLEQQFDRKRREGRKLAATTPAPTAENARAIQGDVICAQAALAEIEGRLGGCLDGAEPSLSRTEAFFALAAFVEKTRERAAKLGVGVGPGEDFGFSAYAHEGPEAELIPAVLRQRVVIEYLANALLESRPQELLAIQRERPRGAAAGSAIGSEPGLRDLFALERTASIRRPGLFEAMAFRLVFTGHTAVLRAFLNRLAGCEISLVVRGIEVEPASAPEGRTATNPGRADRAAVGAALPLVVPVPRKFTVTVECLELTALKPAG